MGWSNINPRVCEPLGAGTIAVTGCPQAPSSAHSQLFTDGSLTGCGKSLTEYGRQVALPGNVEGVGVLVMKSKELWNSISWVQPPSAVYELCDLGPVSEIPLTFSLVVCTADIGRLL